MSMTENPVVKVMLMLHITEEQFTRNDIPARSKLYGLAPCGLGTVWQESLTSYLNRLAWRHHIPPRHLVAQELLPRLSQSYSRRQLGGFSCPRIAQRDCGKAHPGLKSESRSELGV